ncbi:calcium-dependent protein kinase 2-like [Oppia nitens]|uniref:calcium-dependent protein kinase 2-like n=1 Tax=Oppia nitens TaxID=1686743 RepID=UPI0023DA55D3|nr:calcium-dependent protein kinase 2-like [Oppia nitens]
MITFPDNIGISDIQCGDCHSLALTSNGWIYGWGDNSDGQTGCGQHYYPFVDCPIRVRFHPDIQIKSIYCHNNSSYAITDDTIDGVGTYGQVYKVEDRETNQLFAIKEIFNDINNSYLIDEVKNLLKLRSKYVVYYYDGWIESDFLYIQMELCLQSLGKLLEIKGQTFGRQANHRCEQPIDLVEYYITSHIIQELCECVEYLHTRQPPVIHRDLKPENILIQIINDKSIGNRFIKLCDFGLATEHNRWVGGQSSELHTNKTGTQLYRAPEVNRDADDRIAYNEKSDVYSLVNV